ncbi:MAG: DoxX family protein [Cyclobacteriaceae bacterium]|nr:DoxX family protein [Cyclobacteriaceae bacterium]
MIKRFLSPDGLSTQSGIAIVRIAVGFFMVYHGKEVFDSTKIQEYGKWMGDIHLPFPLLMAYLGKGSEFVGGILLMFGFLTRIGALMIVVTMTIICFRVGEGRFLMEDQHPFMFALISLLFVFSGGGPFSLDAKVFNRFSK